MNDLDSMVRQAQADLAAVYSAVKKVLAKFAVLQLYQSTTTV